MLNLAHRDMGLVFLQEKYLASQGKCSLSHTFSFLNYGKCETHLYSQDESKLEQIQGCLHKISMLQILWTLCSQGDRLSDLIQCLLFWVILTPYVLKLVGYGEKFYTVC
jgi:hypothetical protein